MSEEKPIAYKLRLVLDKQTTPDKWAAIDDALDVCAKAIDTILGA